MKTITLHPEKPQSPKRHAPKGRQVDPQALSAVQGLLADPPAPPARERLIEVLHRLQDAMGHLSAAHLAALAQWMRIPQAEVYEVATFYHHFDVVADGESPPPPCTVRVCSGLSCEMAGASALLDALQRSVGEGVRVQPAPCVGRCEQAPAVVVHQHPLAEATVETVGQALKAGLRHAPPPAHESLEAYRQRGGYRQLQRCLTGELSGEAVIESLSGAGLRGLGGAGFPAGRKWRAVMAEPAPRWMAVNIDEGEPGTFKDRWYLEREPHRFLEGLLIAAWVVGISRCVLYLRDEYHGARGMLQAELARLQAEPLWPEMPAIELRRGAGAYICGEESAMLESIEGKRGLPRQRPPYVAQVGLFGRPTLAHNLETLHWVPETLEKGAAWWTAHGRHGRTGLRSFSVSGRVRLPGVKLAPAGITVRELIDEYCGGMQPGHRFYAYLPGGASGGILPAYLGDVPLDFDTLQAHGAFIGSAAVVVLSEQDSAQAAARNAMRFFRDESCGQCTPCRSGTAKAVQLMDAPRWDTALMAELSLVMREASICGLGQAAPNPMDSVIRHFPQELLP